VLLGRNLSFKKQVKKHKKRDFPHSL